MQDEERNVWKKNGFFFSYTHIKKSSTKIVVLILILVFQYKFQDLPFLSLVSLHVKKNKYF